jgi:serine/threonine protein phosphatase PrpC
LTDVGLSRSENQDACALFSTKAQALIAIVADGMGGHAGGATASRIAIETLHERLSPTNEEIDGDELASAIKEANDRIYGRALNEPELRGMGTTVVVLLIRPDGRTWVAHVGDSRAYRLRGGVFEALTQDHSVVAELVRAGALSEEQAEVDPRRNEILRSVGAASSVEVDVSIVSLKPDDRFLLCSDGLTGPVDTQEISNILGQYDPEDATRTLIARANEAGSPDNITAIALHYPDPLADTDTHEVMPQPETTASEFDLIAAENEEARLERARRLLVLVALVGVALLVSVIMLLVYPTSVPYAQPVAAEPLIQESPDSRSTGLSDSSQPYELEPQLP